MECKPNIIASVSGGLTSMRMAIWLYENYRKTHSIKFVFANTSSELEETLKFVDICSYVFNLNIVWLEAVVYPGRKGTGYKIVSFETAARDNSVFESVVAKYGIANQSYKHCNRELKLAPIHKYATDLFGGYKFKRYSTAIGIRVDEIDRMDAKAKEQNYIYPLVGSLPQTKQQVREFWDNQVVTLNIPEHHGNCQCCFKKSNRKLATISVENPSWFDFQRHLENTYSHVKQKPGYEPRKIFRGNRTVDDIFAIARDEQFVMFDDPNFKPTLEEIDIDQACSLDCG